MPPSNLVDQLIRDEGEILHAYQDDLGFWTIGVGTLIDARKGGGITREESRYLLNNRIRRAHDQIRISLPWMLPLEFAEPIRFAALVNMVFNMGIEKLLEFHDMLKFFQAGEYKAAAAAGRDSLWYKQVGARAERLMLQLETGIWH